MSKESRETTEMVDDDPKQEQRKSATVGMPKGSTFSEVPVSDMEQWGVAEMVDEAIQAGLHSPFMRNEYLYAFYQGKQLIAGLTAPMYNHLGKIEKIVVNPANTKFTEEDGWLHCEVQATQNVDGETFYGQGFGSRPIPSDVKYRKFVKQTVYSIARRNAIKQLLPFDLIVGTLDKLLTAEGGMIPGDTYKQQAQQGKPQQNDHWTPPPQQQQAPPPQQQVSALPPPTGVEKAKQEAFDVFRRFKTELETAGVSAEDFWQGVRDEFGVESKEEMTEAQWDSITRDLQFVDKETGVLFAEWIQNMMPEEEAETDPDAEETPPF